MLTTDGPSTNRGCQRWKRLRSVRLPKSAMRSNWKLCHIARQRQQYFNQRFLSAGHDNLPKTVQ